MAKKRGKTEPDLITQKVVDETTGAKVTIHRRGILTEREINVPLSFPLASEYMAQFLGANRDALRLESERDRFIEFRQEICRYLEEKGIPSCRTPQWVKVQDEPPRPKAESDTAEFLASRYPYEIGDWYFFAKEMTSALSRERLLIEYLRHIDSALNAFDDRQFAILLAFAESRSKYHLAISGINVAAAEHVEAAQSAAAAGQKSAETRREKAERWRQGALALAKVLRAKQPYLSQDDLASEIVGSWKDEHVILPNHATIVVFIREKERTGELSKQEKPRRNGK